MPASRPSLSRPTYGAMTGNLNWRRGMGDMLAQPGHPFAPPVADVAPAPAPVDNSPRGRFWRTQDGRFAGGSRRMFNDFTQQEF